MIYETLDIAILDNGDKVAYSKSKIEENPELLEKIKEAKTSGMSSKPQLLSDIISKESEDNNTQNTKNIGSHSRDITGFNSDGDRLSANQLEYFKNSKAVDENGNLQVVYHGTVSDFTVFERSFANPEGDMGSGSYFTTSNEDVEMNYAIGVISEFLNRNCWKTF